MDLFAENGEVNLHAARLILRSPGVADRQAIVDGFNDYAIAQWLSVVPHPYGLDDADWYTDHVAKGDVRAWMIHDVSGLVGGIGVGDELGYWLARSAWGKGYLTEAAQTVLAHVFADLATTQLIAGHFLQNTASGNVLRKLGFEPTHLRVRPCKARGHDMDSQEMRLTRDRWQSLSNPR